MIAMRRTMPLWRPVMWGIVAALLLLPLVAMQVTREVDWTAGDFLIAAVLLGGAALLVELAMRTLVTPRSRTIAVAAIGAALVLVWLQGAVGLV